jgi:hypothetical protein
MVFKIEANLSSCMLEHLYASITKDDTKENIVHNIESTQDNSIAWAQLEETMNDNSKNQSLIINRITNLEKELLQGQHPPSNGPPQRDIQERKPRDPNEQRTPNTLDP